MYRKLQIDTVQSSIIYLKYVVDMGSTVTVQLVDPITKQALYNLERVNSVTAAIRTDQFVVDEDINAIVINLANRGKTVLITYYTDGTQNPFYASSNLHTFISKVLKWTDNRLVDGLYLYWDDCDRSNPVKKIKEGSFVYDGSFYVYQGGIFDIRDYAPPTVIGYYRGYRIFINQEIIQSYLNTPASMLTQVGIITSSATHTAMDSAKLDVMTLYDSMYNSEPLDIAFVYIRLNDSREYDIWVEYPKEQRTL